MIVLQHIKKVYTIVQCIFFLQDKKSSTRQKFQWLTANFHFHTCLPICTLKSKLSINLKHYPILVCHNYYKFYPSPIFQKSKHTWRPSYSFLCARWLYALWCHVLVHHTLMVWSTLAFVNNCSALYPGYFMSSFRLYISFHLTLWVACMPLETPLAYSETPQ